MHRFHAQNLRNRNAAKYVWAQYLSPSLWDQSQVHVSCLTNLDHGEFGMPNWYGCLMSNQIQLYYSYITLYKLYSNMIIVQCCMLHAISSCLLPNNTEVIQAFLQLSASQATSADRVYSRTTMTTTESIWVLCILVWFFPLQMATMIYNGFCEGFVVLSDSKLETSCLPRPVGLSCLSRWQQSWATGSNRSLQMQWYRTTRKPAPKLADLDIKTKEY
jgi:hypothetical protein